MAVNRKELLNKMIRCFDTCVLDMQYTTDKALDRVLEIVEENTDIKLEDDDSDDDNYCGAI